MSEGFTELKSVKNTVSVRRPGQMVSLTLSIDEASEENRSSSYTS